MAGDVLFDDYVGQPSGSSDAIARRSSTFLDNVKLPVHRWFRYSAGFSGQWAEGIIRDAKRGQGDVRVLDPFAGSGTTLVAAQDAGAEGIGIESHPFVARVARAKLARDVAPNEFLARVNSVLKSARGRRGSVDGYPALIRKCYRDSSLADLDRLRRALVDHVDTSAASELAWLAFVSILRRTSHVGTANWQYVLPNKSKKNVDDPFAAFHGQAELMCADLTLGAGVQYPTSVLIEADARACAGVPDGYATLVITSPPYPNNYDYADATRLEMCVLREIDGWGDLQAAVRKHLVRSCSQHVPEKTVNLGETLASVELDPIRAPLTKICEELSQIRLTKGGKKTYHLMVACYFLDIAKTWRSLRRVCASPSRVCFVIGDSAPYGVYVPVMEFMGQLAEAAGFYSCTFERVRDRNVKWKNRKHRVPLCEGRLWVSG